MFIINLIGVILGIAGITLTIPTISNKIKISTTIGWAMAAVGMFIISFCGFAVNDFIFAILSLIFAVIDLYFCVNDLKK